MVVGHLNILLIGKGAREHSLAWKLAQSPSVKHIYVAPGNGGTENNLSNVSNISNINEDDYPALVTLAKELSIGLVVVGPDGPVVDGMSAYFEGSKLTKFNNPTDVF